MLKISVLRNLALLTEYHANPSVQTKTDIYRGGKIETKRNLFKNRNRKHSIHNVFFSLKSFLLISDKLLKIDQKNCIRPHCELRACSSLTKTFAMFFVLLFRFHFNLIIKCIEGIKKVNHCTYASLIYSDNANSYTDQLHIEAIIIKTASTRELK